MAVMVVIGVVSVMVASLDYGGYPIPETLNFGEGSLIRTIGINIGMLVLLIGLTLSVYGNVLRARYMRQRSETEEGEPAATTADD
jgi:hypothetical protein